MKVKPDNYMTIQGFMRSELNLKGNELMVYAIIYGFTQTEKQWFTGSRQYLADWLGCSVRTVQNVLNKMTADGLLIQRKGRRKDGALCCDYQATIPGEPSEKTALGAVKKLHYAKGKNFTRPSEKFSPHNIDNKYIYNIETYKGAFDISVIFSEVWEMYPKKTAKKQSETEFIKTMESGVAPEQIIDGVKRYIRHVEKNRIETRFVKSLANFLKTEAWKDEYDTDRERFESEYDRQNIAPDKLEELIFE